MAAAPFDLVRLEQYLAAHIPGFAGPVELTPFAGGQSNPTYKLTAGSQRYVLRKKPAGVLLPSAHAVEREYKVMAALANTAVPVAKQHVLCEDPSIIGTPFYVMDFVEGRVLFDPSIPGVSKAERTAMYEEMNRVIAALHAVDFRAVGLGDYGKAEQYVERQIGRWTKQYRASETQRIEAMERLIEWLPKNVPARDEAAITHGDFRLDNLMFHPTEPRILAVLDWELSTIGHPLADFAYHVMVWRVAPNEFRGLLCHDLAALGIPDEKAYVARYFERTGRVPPTAAEWNFYLAFNLFRLSAICQGIMKRALDGTAASDKAFENGRLAVPIAEAGWRQVEAGG